MANGLGAGMSTRSIVRVGFAFILAFACALLFVGGANAYQAQEAYYYDSFTTACNGCVPVSTTADSWPTGNPKGEPFAIGMTKLTDCGNTNWSNVETESTVISGDYHLRIIMLFPESSFCSTFQVGSWVPYSVSWRVAWSNQ